MAWYSNIFNRKTKEATYPDSRRIPTPSRTNAGVVVTPDTGLLNDTAFACRRYISQSLGLLPARVLQGNGRTSNLIFNHPVDTVLNYRANPELSPFQLRETLTSWAITHGNGIAEIEKDLVGRVVNLWPIEPWRSQILRDRVSGQLLYQVDMGAGQDPVFLSSSDVLHIRGFGDGAVGISVMEYAAQTIGWARATEIFGAAFFGKGLHFGGTAIFKDTATDDTIEATQERLEESFSGAPNNAKWFVGDGSMTIQRMSATNDESQFIQTMQHQVSAICRWFGVPPHKVAHLINATFSNIESQSIEVVTDCIAPWALRWEQECSYKLFGQNRTNLKVEFDLKGMLRGAYKERQEGLQVMRRNAVINADEWREFEGMGPIGGEEGKIYIVEKNMVPLDMIREVSKPKEKIAPAPSPPTDSPTSSASPLSDLSRKFLDEIDYEFAKLEIKEKEEARL